MFGNPYQNAEAEPSWSIYAQTAQASVAAPVAVPAPDLDAVGEYSPDVIAVDGGAGPSQAQFAMLAATSAGQSITVGVPQVNSEFSAEQFVNPLTVVDEPVTVQDASPPPSNIAMLVYLVIGFAIVKKVIS